MTPTVQSVMQTFFGTLAGQVVPTLSSEYLIGSTTVIAMMMFMTAAEYERGAEIREAENRQMRALFGHAAPQVRDAALADRLKTASNLVSPSLRISDLDRTNGELKRVLIELHTHVENLDGPDAADLDLRIWSFMREAAEARKLPHPMAG